MKNKKIFLDWEEEEPINIGLMRLAKKIPEHELFFEINKINSFNFSRTEDFKIKKFCFSKFETFHPDTKTNYQIVANKSIPLQKKTSNELFAQADEIKFLMPKHKDVDFLIYAKNSIPDFSLFLLPEKLLFQIQNFQLSPNNEMYKLIQYYE